MENNIDYYEEAKKTVLKIDNFYEEKEEDVFLKVDLYLNCLSCGNALVLIEEIIDEVEEGAITWEQIGKTKKELLSIAKSYWLKRVNAMDKEKQKMNKCFHRVRLALLQ